MLNEQKLVVAVIQWLYYEWQMFIKPIILESNVFEQYLLNAIF